jgi:hypothetical protein
LHRLWFVLLKERNLLATQEAEAQRLGQRWFGKSRVYKTKLSMARIKTILLERKRMHSQSTHLMAIKNRDASKPLAGDLMIDMEMRDRLRLAKGKRHIRQKIRFKRRQYSKF